MSLRRAVKNNNVNMVHMLLDRGVNPNYLNLKFKDVNQNTVEIIKLLLKYGITVDEDFINKIFVLTEKKYYQDLTEILTSCISSDTSDDSTLIEGIFRTLSHHDEYPVPQRKEILKLLIKKGLPVNGISCKLDIFSPVNDSAPLHFSVFMRLYDFISLLLKNGADVNQNNLWGYTPLRLSIDRSSYMAWLLLSNGARVNDKAPHDGKTVLHVACEHEYCREIEEEEKTLCLLLKYDADVNILDNDRRTPLMYADLDELKYTMIKHLAVMKFENKFICRENLNYIERHRRLQKVFNTCLTELRRLKSITYNGFSLYYILRLRYQYLELTLLTKNQEFVEAFTWWNREAFEYYGKDLDSIFKKVLEKRDKLLAKENELRLIFKDYLPDLVTRKIAYFFHEDLFFEKQIDDSLV